MTDFAICYGQGDYSLHNQLRAAEDVLRSLVSRQPKRCYLAALALQRLSFARRQVI